MSSMKKHVVLAVAALVSMGVGGCLAGAPDEADDPTVEGSESLMSPISSGTSVLLEHCSFTPKGFIVCLGDPVSSTGGGSEGTPTTGECSGVGKGECDLANGSYQLATGGCYCGNDSSCQQQIALAGGSCN